MPPAIRPFEPQPLTPQAPARTDATRSAQRAAFFQQFSGAVEAPAPRPTLVAPPAAPVAAAPVRAAPAPRLQPITEEPPTRILRPGSFVDLKV